MSDYAYPVSKLLALGEPDPDDWADYRALGLGPEHAGELTRLASDRRLHPEEPTSPADHGPHHAWRALGQLGVTEALGPLFRRLDEEKLDDSPLGEELIEVCLELGGASRAVLQELAADATHPGHVRARAAVCLAGVVEDDPAQAREVATFLAQQLEATEDRAFGTGLVEALLELEAVESAAAIEKAYQRGVVDAETVGPWDEVRDGLGLVEEDEGPTYFGPPLQPFHPSMAPDRAPPPPEETPKLRGKGSANGKKKPQRKKRRD